MRPLIPRVAAIHDLSGFGRSSLCNVLPILSTMGIQACPVPTAVLSTHSGGFDGYTFRDLTEDIPGFIRHWKELGLEFDGIYSGFLGSPRQVELVRELIHTFRTPQDLGGDRPGHGRRRFAVQFHLQGYDRGDAPAHRRGGSHCPQPD